MENSSANPAMEEPVTPAPKSKSTFESWPKQKHIKSLYETEQISNPFGLHPSGKQNYTVRLSREQSRQLTDRGVEARKAIQAREAIETLQENHVETANPILPQPSDPFSIHPSDQLIYEGPLPPRQFPEAKKATEARDAVEPKQNLLKSIWESLPQVSDPSGIHSSGKPNREVSLTKEQERQLKEAYEARHTLSALKAIDAREALVASEVRAMNYPNYADSPGTGPTNPRQAPPSPSQGMNHTNGMNGGGVGMGGMVGYPTPAGHQSDLNYVMSMVEELSQTLHQNQQLTASVVEKMGKVREKAKNMNLTNDELVAVVAAELNEDSKNLEKENSELRKALEKAEYDRKENFKLACHGANILADITEKMHRYKEQHETDTLAWHKNYRKQLSDEREENLNLRNQINDMKAAAYRASEFLRAARRCITDNPELEELTIQVHQYRTERRWWKRMALPLIPDDDEMWSDDDDLIDPEEKKRLAMLQAEKERKEKEEAEGIAPQS